MADYVSILKRTLDGLGDKATPALRERVYGRARDAVKRQLDGMNPPPAEDVVAKQYDVLERAIAEVEARYADSVASESAENAAPSEMTEAPAPAPSTDQPTEASRPAPSDVEADSPVPSEASEPAGGDLETDTGGAVGSIDPQVPEPATSPDEMPAATTDIERPDDPVGALETGADEPEGPFPQADTNQHGSSSRDVDISDMDDPSSAAPVLSDAEPVDRTYGSDEQPGDVPPPPSLASLDALRQSPPPAPVDADDVGSATDEAPPVDSLGSDEVGVESGAGTGGAAVGAAAGATGASLAASIRDGSFFVGNDPERDPPGGRLVPEDLPARAEIGPHGDPVLDESVALPLEASAGAVPQPPGGLDPSLFSEPDYVPGETIDVDQRVSVEPSGPPDELLASTAPSMPRPAPLEPELDTAAAPEPQPTPVAAPPSVGATLPRPAEAARPTVHTSNERKGRGFGGLLAAAAVLVAVLAGGWLLRDEIADATGVEAFRTAFGTEDAIGDLIGASSTEDDTTVVAVGDDAVTDDAAPAPAADEPAATPPADAPADGGTEVAATGPEKFQDRLPGAGTSDGVDVAPSGDDVVVRDVPVVPTDGDGATAEDATPVEIAPADPAGDAPADDGTEIAAADPVENATAAPEGDARSFLVAEPLGGQPAAPREGAVSWSVVSESPGRDLPPEPAIRGEVALADGLGLSVTVRRNADTSLPASHLIELVFALPDGGEAIRTLPLVGFKDSLQVAARPLVAVPAKITDDFFLVGLNNLATAIESNLALMSSEDFMDVQLVYDNGRRATLTIEKGAKGDEVFAEVLDAWRNAPLPG